MEKAAIVVTDGRPGQVSAYPERRSTAPDGTSNTLIWSRECCCYFDNYQRAVVIALVRWHLLKPIHEAESWILSSSVPRTCGEKTHYIRAVRLALVCMSRCVQTKRVVECLCWGGVCALAVDGWWRGGRLRWVPPSVPSCQLGCAGLE